jgi:hypothetical protein
MKLTMPFLVFGMMLIALLTGCTKVDDKGIYAAAFSVCEGKPVADAAEYKPDNGKHHPIVELYYDKKESDPASYSYNFWNQEADWSPRKVSKMQLVACIHDKSVRLGQSEYWVPGLGTSGNTTVISEREVVIVQIFRARDGTLVVEKKFEGEDPDCCGQVENLPANSPEVTFTGKVDWGDIGDFVTSLYEP